MPFLKQNRWSIAEGSLFIYICKRLMALSPGRGWESNFWSWRGRSDWHDLIGEGKTSMSQQFKLGYRIGLRMGSWVITFSHTAVYDFPNTKFTLIFIQVTRTSGGVYSYRKTASSHWHEVEPYQQLLIWIRTAVIHLGKSYQHWWVWWCESQVQEKIASCYPQWHSHGQKS